eukprot:4843142-Alexandrium_andersonii.AAC.1
MGGWTGWARVSVACSLAVKALGRCIDKETSALATAKRVKLQCKLEQCFQGNKLAYSLLRPPWLGLCCS